MAAKDVHNPAEGYIQTPYPVQGLPRVVRHITTRDAQGRSVFLSTDIGDHHRELANKSAIANTLYSTSQVPVDLKDNVDVKHAQQKEPDTTIKNGTICRMIDFAPGGVSPMNQVNSLDYAIVIEGIFKMVLDSGEERIMQRGDVAIQRSTAYRWVNVTGNGLLPGRILLILHDVKDSSPKGSKGNGSLSVRGKNYVGLRGYKESAVPAPSEIQLQYDASYDYFERGL